MWDTVYLFSIPVGHVISFTIHQSYNSGFEGGHRGYASPVCVCVCVCVCVWNLTKHIEYAESEFRSFEFVIFNFIVVYMKLQ